MKKLSFWLVLIGILSGLSICASGFLFYQWLKLPLIIDDTVERVSIALREHVDQELEPAKVAVSRAMTTKSKAGIDAIQRKALNKRIGQDMIDLQSPEVKLLLEMFPRASEYVEKNPDLIMELLPRIQALKGQEGFKLTDLFNPSSSLGGSPSITRKHPFGMKEE